MAAKRIRPRGEERRYPTSEARGGGRDELPHIRGQRQRLGGATPRQRLGVAAGRSNPTSEVRRGSCEEITHVQGKRNPSKMVGVARGIRGQAHKP